MPNESGIKSCRRIHLDHHATPLIPNMLENSDANEWVDAFVKMGVEVVTVFGKDAFGLCYHNAKVA